MWFNVWFIIWPAQQVVMASATRVKEGGQAILVVDKNIAPLLRLADRHYILEKGRTVWSGVSAELAAAPELLHRYLGV